MFSLFDSASILPLHFLHYVLSSELFVRESQIAQLSLPRIHFLTKFSNYFILFSLFFRHSINLSFDSILPISSSSLQKEKKTLENCQSRALCCTPSSIRVVWLGNKKNAEVFVPFSAYAMHNQIFVRFEMPIVIQNTASFVQ